jgi:hypothetical protein
MGATAAQPISPELVLVCPELRGQALELLPTLDPDALFAVEREPAVEHVSFRVAIAAYATEALVLGALRGVIVTAVIAAAAFFLSW